MAGIEGQTLPQGRGGLLQVVLFQGVRPLAVPVVGGVGQVKRHEAPQGTGAMIA